MRIRSTHHLLGFFTALLLILGSCAPQENQKSSFSGKWFIQGAEGQVMAGVSAIEFMDNNRVQITVGDEQSGQWFADGTFKVLEESKKLTLDLNYPDLSGSYTFALDENVLTLTRNGGSYTFGR